jgi:hypothetical protein
MGIDIKDWYWLAGLIEGEGCFYLNTGQGKPKIQVKVKMTDEDVIRRIHSITNLGSVNGPYSNGDAKWKQVYVWTINRQADAAAFMMTIYPLMGIRRQSKMKELLTIWRAIPVYEHQGRIWW